MEILSMYIDVFAVNPTCVPGCKGVPLRLELKDPNVTPYVVPARYYSPKQYDMAQALVVNLLKSGPIREYTSERAIICSTVRKEDGTVRIVQDFRSHNALLKL